MELPIVELAPELTTGCPDYFDRSAGVFDNCGGTLPIYERQGFTLHRKLKQ